MSRADPFSADEYMYSSREHLHVKPFFSVLGYLRTYEISTDGLSYLW